MTASGNHFDSWMKIGLGWVGGRGWAFIWELSLTSSYVAC